MTRKRRQAWSDFLIEQYLQVFLATIFFFPSLCTIQWARVIVVKKWQETIDKLFSDSQCWTVSNITFKRVVMVMLVIIWSNRNLQPQCPCAHCRKQKKKWYQLQTPILSAQYRYSITDITSHHLKGVKGVASFARERPERGKATVPLLSGGLLYSIWKRLFLLNFPFLLGLFQLRPLIISRHCFVFFPFCFVFLVCLGRFG